MQSCYRTQGAYLAGLKKRKQTSERMEGSLLDKMCISRRWSNRQSTSEDTGSRDGLGGKDNDPVGGVVERRGRQRL